MTEAASPSVGGMKRTGKNAFWMVLERMIHLGVAFVVSFIVAAQLGSEDYGRIAVGMALLSLLLPISNIIGQCMLRDMAAEPESAMRLYTAGVVVAGLVTSVIVLLVGIGIIFTVGIGSETGIVTVVIVGSSLLRPLNTVDVFFLKRLESRRTVKIRIIVGLVIGAARVGLLLVGYGVTVIAWTYVVEAMLASIGMWIAFRRVNKEFKWEFNTKRVRTLLLEFTPLFIASSSALVFMKLDQVMLAALSSLSETGVFGLGASLAETPRFPLVALLGSLAPRMLALKNRNPELYWAKLADVSRLITLLGYGLTLGLIFVVAPIAPLLLPPDYDGISIVIVILALTTPFVCLGGILLYVTNWEKLYREALTRNLVAAAMSVGLNFLLLPRYGAVGAAISTLIVTIYVYVIGAALARRTRPVFWLTLPTLEPISSARTLWAHRKESKRERAELRKLAAELSEEPDDPAV
jgi:PST family polysaccharide transporter